jgi:hypothetical protein
MLTEIDDFDILELWADQSGLSTLALYITSRAGETSGRKYFWTIGDTRGDGARGDVVEK